ncbi:MULTISPECIES: aromatic ring-hydroxylating dioxygenase subunit alpha [Paraburkholderia]|jgi:vanillate O-demethylase monooxygenase subunit|uniref:Vanillate O-demethylase monooxygenase subunit n=1 Tax=Paraburkholderia terricola TaxID=169427 RepID=A0A1M6MQA1_9BURK|nr:MULTISPECIES: aromatic ring-hydroxylating dioxygenase subunit alpha [Paraburkholderia]AXE97014.1 aromatic ring-hydroxylating dioxygenase subunit alpha [Paraburkholderia terricola]SDO05946.1 vanillate O-demethylase monooxygenase subunit [Paraburkholderia sediminicola]SHJ85589.1 vanillate O-demethylase monooxygenase subunit [Paraburkholderia terricola]
MPYLLNAWYVAALSSEVTTQAPFARTLLDQPVVLYRDASGEAVALDDRCPHRFAPLSRGQIVDGALACPYHGLRFGSNGHCVFNPHGDGRVPAHARTRCYPTRERYGAVWFWPGDPERAQTAPLPAFDFLDPLRNFTSENYLPTRANYQLSADNLLDLSHFQYLHAGTLGSDEMARSTVRAAVDGETVSVHREATDEHLQPMLMRAFNLAHGTRADRQLDVRWMPPGLLSIAVAVCESGVPELTRVSLSAHWLTPESVASTHYFFAFGLPRDMGEQGAELVRQAARNLIAPFRDEDLPMLEAQQRTIGERDFWSLRPAMLPIDAGAVHARRIMQRLIAEEQRQAEEERGSPQRKAAHAACE